MAWAKPRCKLELLQHSTKSFNVSSRSVVLSNMYIPKDAGPKGSELSIRAGTTTRTCRFTAQTCVVNAIPTIIRMQIINREVVQ